MLNFKIINMILIGVFGFLSGNIVVLADADDSDTDFFQSLELKSVDEGAVFYKGFQPGVVYDANSDEFGWYTEYEEIAKIYRKPRGLDPNEREILEFKSVAELNLVKMNLSNILAIKSHLTGAVLEAFEKSFPVKDGKLLRNSTRLDREVAEYVCETLNSDGYYADMIPMEEDPERPFHAEFMLCNPGEVLVKTTPDMFDFDENGSPVKKKRISS